MKIRQYIVRVFTALAICMLAFAGKGDVLLWQVDINNSATVDNVDNVGVYSFLSEKYGEDNEYGAMVVACDSQGNVITPLYLVAEPEFADIPIDVSDPWMSQTIQSWRPTELESEILFQMQIGNYDEDYNLIPLLYSEWANNSEINRHTHEIGQLSPIAGDWAPNKFYTYVPSTPVPEPTTFLLLLLGFGILALRRKQ